VGKERRRRPRHPAAHWNGRYRFGGASAWRDCELVDVSATGAGFQAYMLATDAVPQADVELELVDRTDPEPDPLRLTGRVRHLARSDQGHLRVGMEFVELTDLEGRLLAMLFRRDSARGRVFR
jgi:PilZ domain